MKINVIGLTGYAQVGKDEAAKALIEALGFTRVSFADPLRASVYRLNPVVFVPMEHWLMPGMRACIIGLSDHAAGYFVRLREVVDAVGWEKAKRILEVRELLQRMGTEVGRELFGERFWVERAATTALNITAAGGRVVFTDVRFPNEAELVRDLSGRVVRIERPGVGPVNAHKSDKPLPDSLVDGIIVNSGTLEDLRTLILEQASARR